MRTQIRGPIGPSAYFLGAYRGYGRHQWSIKWYGWEGGYEIETALQWAFGDHVRLSRDPKDGRRGFDGISDLLGRPIESYTAGRSGGWLVIDSELSEDELVKVDEHVARCMAALPEFLREEREFHAAAVAAENTHHAED
jgi:hypothetical protein